MKKIITLLLIVGTFVCSVFAKDVAEGYWISIDEKTNSITAGWKFYVNAQGQMEAVIVFTPGCNSTTLADGCISCVDQLDLLDAVSFGGALMQK